MQLKNNESRNRQFFYRDKDGAVQFVHIPGKATVELDDDIFKQLCASKTTVQIMKEVVAPIESESEVKMEKKDVLIKEYYETGKTKVINLMKQSIEDGELTVVERQKVTEAEINQLLTDKGISVKDMSQELKLELFNKLV